MKVALSVPILLVLAACELPVSYDWPMFGRDASRNAVSPEKNPPLAWSIVEGKEQNVAWKARLGSECFTSPVVADGLIWIGTNNNSPRDPSHTEDGGVLMCFRERDGAFLWQHVSPRRQGMYWGFDWQRAPLRGCPLVESDRLWFVNSNWEVICLDIGPLKRGEGPAQERWRVDLVSRVGARPMLPGMGFGLACSIGASHRGKIYVSTGQGFEWDRQKPKWPEAPTLVCLDQETGEILGREQSGISARLLTACWSSPVTATLADGRTLVVYGAGDGYLYAFDPDPIPGTGVLKERWRVDCNPPGSRERKDAGPYGILATPVVHQSRAYIGLGDDDGAQDGNLCCVDLTTGTLVWSSVKLGVTNSTPVVHGGMIFAPDRTGFLHGFEADNGRLLWTHDTLSMIVTSPLLVHGRLFLSTGDDQVSVFEIASPKGKVRRISSVASKDSLLASPIFAHGTLYVATGRWLYAIRETGPGPAANGPEPPKRGRSPDALFVPTPRDVVSKMLELSEMKSGEWVYDLGSGDGRIVIAAARRSGRAVGYEIDQTLVEQSRAEIEKQGVADRARIEHDDLLNADLSQANVVTLYVGARLNRLLVPKLKSMKPGSRIVSHEFEIPELPLERSTTVVSNEDGREHRLFLYRIGGSK